MCQEVCKRCSCGRERVFFHLRDNIMGQEVIDRLFCPVCSGTIVLDEERMIEDNGWVIEYDMELARMYAIAGLGMSPERVGPGFVFDEGYAAWREMYPGESREVAAERARILAIREEDPREYLLVINAWAVARIERLKAAGWRRARRA